MSKTTRNQSELKKQISYLILNDDSLLKSIVEAVSSAIIDNMCENESFISKIADKIAQNEQTKDKIKQDLYQSLSFDQEQLQNKYTALQNSHEQIKKSCDSLGEAYDALEQYGRRNCLIFHGIDEVINKGVNESTDEKIIDVVNNKLGIKINPSDLDRSHRLMRKAYYC